MDKIKQLQELSFHSWPGTKIILQDGWLIRMSSGVHQRSNSVLPNCYYGDDVEQSIAMVETITGKCGLDPRFQIAEYVYPGNLDAILEIQGYQKMSPTHVMILEKNDLGNYQQVEEKTEFAMQVSSGKIDAKHPWIRCVQKFGNYSDEKIAEKIEVINTIDPILATSYFYSLIDQSSGEIIAVSFGVSQYSGKHFFGIFEVAVDPSMRGKGIGQYFMELVLRDYYENKTDVVYLQVDAGNKPAIGLYQKLGFEISYSYHYRFKRLLS